MLNWKLLGDLSSSELKLECERAGIAASQKDAHNVIKLSKYIMNSGYDPESFFFNTHYQADKTHPLLGMTSAAGFNAAAKVSNAQATSSCPKTTAPAPPLNTKTGFCSKALSLEGDLHQMFQKVSQGIEKMVSLMEDKNCGGQCKPSSGSGLGGNGSSVGSSEPDLPYWDSSESDYSFGSSGRTSVTSSMYSSGRRYNKSLLIKDGICLAFQHGNCPNQYEDKHVNAFGQKVLHFCGLCWTDSPDNQCYNPANQCPGQYFYC